MSSTVSRTHSSQRGTWWSARRNAERTNGTARGHRIGLVTAVVCTPFHGETTERIVCLRREGGCLPLECRSTNVCRYVRYAHDGNRLPASSAQRRSGT